MKVDFGKTVQDFGRHRAGFPESLFDRLAGFGVGLSGQRVIDLGTGTGALARELAKRGCSVTGVDISAELIEAAKRLDEAAGVKAEYREGNAEDTGLDSGIADVVTAAQCWHWFNGTAVAREVTRLLKPDGKIAIIQFDWLPLADSVVAHTEDLIRAHNPEWDLHGGNGIHPSYFSDLDEARFREIESFSYDVSVPYTHEGWRGRIRSSAGVGGSLPPEKASRFDIEHAALLKSRFPKEPLDVPHRVFAVLAKRPVINTIMKR